MCASEQEVSAEMGMWKGSSVKEGMSAFVMPEPWEFIIPVQPALGHLRPREGKICCSKRGPEMQASCSCCILSAPLLTHSLYHLTDVPELRSFCLVAEMEASGAA